MRGRGRMVVACDETSIAEVASGETGAARAGGAPSISADTVATAVNDGNRFMAVRSPIDATASTAAMEPAFRSAYAVRMADASLTDPMAWRPLKAPSLAEFEVIATAAFQRLPQRFRARCEGVVVHVEDYPTDEVLKSMGIESELDLLGLFQGVGLPFQSDSAPVQMPNMVWLYRVPILLYWAEHDETLGHIITHVLVHEIGHHFGLSDDDMMAIEKAAT